jgi:hypothetical protein
MEPEEVDRRRGERRQEERRQGDRRRDRERDLAQVRETQSAWEALKAEQRQAGGSRRSRFRRDGER